MNTCLIGSSIAACFIRRVKIFRLSKKRKADFILRYQYLNETEILMFNIRTQYIY
jgi:hypothetical protein